MRQRGPGPAPAPAPADPERAASVRAIAEQLGGLRGPLLPVLHEVVATHGYVADDDVLVVAEVLNLSRADVHGVVTFYSDLRRTPPVAHRVELCRGEACQARGGEELHDRAADRWLSSTAVEVGVPAAGMHVPTEGEGLSMADEIARWNEVGPRYGLEVVGPPLPV